MSSPISSQSPRAINLMEAPTPRAKRAQARAAAVDTITSVAPAPLPAHGLESGGTGVSREPLRDAKKEMLDQLKDLVSSFFENAKSLSSLGFSKLKEGADLAKNKTAELGTFINSNVKAFISWLGESIKNLTK